ncbi:hypothetical protein Syun_000962 [Stephania yunnanensis]|uniref:Uncharacterized protein n=1 Tax=Stephania yunnanensis TaxID=152371 RepID=A0AAP0LCU2_9MAGN
MRSASPNARVDASTCLSVETSAQFIAFLVNQSLVTYNCINVWLSKLNLIHKIRVRVERAELVDMDQGQFEVVIPFPAD